LPTTNTELLVLSVRDVEKLVSMRKCIELQEEAFRSVHFNRALNARNSFLYMDKHKAYIKLMGCYVEGGESRPTDTLVVKAIDAFEENPRKYGLPVVLGSLTLFDSNSGLPVCFMDGAYITALRTGAAGGLAAKYLAREDTRAIGVIGTGSTAGFTTKAVLELLPDIQEVKIFSRSPEHRENLSKKINASGRVSSAIPVASAIEATASVEVIVTGTTSATPVLSPEMVKPGQHVNAMGIKTEIDPRVFPMSNKIVADSTPIACSDGKTSVAIGAGAVKESDVYADLGELVCGKKSGRTSATEITIFDSSGVAAQDAVLARYVYEEARKAGLGTYVDVFGGLAELLMP